MVERMLFRSVKAAFWRAQDAFLPEFVCFKRAIKANKWSDRRLKRESIMAALTFLHVIMVINQLNAKFAAAFSMRSRISDAFRRIWKYNARFFTLHLRFLSGISRVPSPYFGRVFMHKEEDCARFFARILKVIRWRLTGQDIYLGVRAWCMKRQGPGS